MTSRKEDSSLNGSLNGGRNIRFSLTSGGGQAQIHEADNKNRRSSSKKGDGGGDIEQGFEDEPESRGEDTGGGGEGGGEGMTAAKRCGLKEAENLRRMDVDTARVYRAVRDAGLYSFGIVAVELWVLDERFDRLVRADGGWWRSPLFPASDALERLEDSGRADYAKPLPQIPGAGLAGNFWALSSSMTHSSSLTWVDIRTILNDPDQAPYLRTTLLDEAGFGKATGVPFNVKGGYQGIVVYLARPSAKESLLKEEVNDDYLRHAAEHIGITSSLSRFRQASVATKLARNQKSFRRIKTRLQVLNVLSQSSLNSQDRNDQNQEYKNSLRNKNYSHPQSNHAENGFYGHHHVLQFVEDNIRQGAETIAATAKTLRQTLRERVITLSQKSRGGNLQPPPQMTYTQALWSLIGAFLALIILSRISFLIQRLTNDQYALIFGPFVSFAASQYGLTASPAAQPRNALYGQFVSISIALSLKSLSQRMSIDDEDSSVPEFLRMAMAVSLSVAVMAKCGIMHPPAASSALIFATDNSVNGIYFLLILFGYIISIIMAIFINNLSQKRQYPIYWQLFFGFPNLLVSSCGCANNNNNNNNTATSSSLSNSVGTDDESANGIRRRASWSFRNRP